MIFVILAVSAFGTIIGLFLYARWNYGVLESLGYTVVKPLHVLLGNTADYHLKITHLEDIERFKTLGPVYGFYKGRQPQVHICDAELIKHIMIKDYYEHFRDRRIIDFGSPLLNEMPDFLPYNKWKPVRQLYTASFTASKLKQMSSSYKDSLTDYTTRLKKEQKFEKVDIKQEIFTMLTDLISRSVFSIRIDNSGGDLETRFGKILTAIVQGEGGAEENLPTFLNSLSYSFPFLKRFMPSPGNFNVKASDEFIKIFRTIVEVRKKSGEKQKDFVEYILGLMDKLETPEFKNNNITELTLLCQALVFFFAGQDQISIVAAYAILSASKDKEIEDRIIEEIDDFLERHNGQIEYDNIFELKYVKAVTEEASRLVSFFDRPERICTKDWEKDGIKIKKGMMVVMPIWAANRNPEYFSDPEKFDPERFLPENKKNLHPCANSAFGHGPKNCPAVKFASDILLYCLVYLYKDFRFKIRPDSQLTFYPGNEIMSIPRPIYLDLLTR